MSIAAETVVGGIELTLQERTAAIASVRQLEHRVFVDGRPGAIDELNELRSSLGWLEIDMDGCWRWPS